MFRILVKLWQVDGRSRAKSLDADGRPFLILSGLKVIHVSRTLWGNESGKPKTQMTLHGRLVMNI